MVVTRLRDVKAKTRSFFAVKLVVIRNVHSYLESYGLDTAALSLYNKQLSTHCEQCSPRFTTVPLLLVLSPTSPDATQFLGQD